MRGYVAKPVNPRRLQGHIGVKPARDGPVDDRLLLLVQQFDEAALGKDEAVKSLVGGGEKSYNVVLFLSGR